MSSSIQKTKSYHTQKISTGRSITLDGCDDDDCWHTAHILTDFTFPWSGLTPPTTEFRALWKDDSFYFRFDVTDTDVVLAEGADVMEKMIGSDRVEIFFSTGPELKPYYSIEIDPRGEILDYETRYHRQMNWEWSCEGLAVKTSLTNFGYIVKGEIPMSTFQKLNCLHEDNVGSYLIAGLYRAEFSHDQAGGPVIEDWISWIDPQVTTPDFHVSSSFGTIRFVK